MDLEVPDLLIADELVDITMSHNPCGPQFSPLTFCPLSLRFSIFNTATAQAHFGGELGQRGWGGPRAVAPTMHFLESRVFHLSWRLAHVAPPASPASMWLLKAFLAFLLTCISTANTSNKSMPLGSVYQDLHICPSPP